MGNKIENAVDGMLDSIFGGLQPQLNLINMIGGIILVLLGLRFLKNKSSDHKNLIGWIFLGIGCLGFFIGVVKLVISFVS